MKIRKLFKGFLVLLVVASIALNGLEIFGKGKLKPSSWFGSDIEQVQPLNGKDGADGKDGVNGKDGKDGLPGADGVAGQDGADGADGKDGETPYIGENGNWFIGEIDTGVKAAGEDSIKGQDGKDGETPYIGENGNWFIGEVDTGVRAAGQDGADGAPGADGVNGLDGADGADGKDGETPYIGENGNWFIGETDTGVRAAGQDGADGAPGADGLNGSDGADGADGADGKTPYIGENGNWFIGETDTGVRAAGQDGADGQDGETPVVKVYNDYIQNLNVRGEPSLDGSLVGKIAFVSIINSSTESIFTAGTGPVLGLCSFNAAEPKCFILEFNGYADGSWISVTIYPANGDEPLEGFILSDYIYRVEIEA